MFNPDDPQSQYPQNSPNDPYHPDNQYNQSNLKSLYPQDNRNQRTRTQDRRITWLVILLLIGTCTLTILSVRHFQAQPPAFFFQVQTLSIGTLLIIGALTFGLLIFFRALAKAEQGSFVGKLSRGLFFLTILAIIGAFLFWTILLNPDIGLTRTGFTRTSISINAGDAIYFHNLANGVTQLLCVGVNQHCQPGNSDPAQLDHGLVIQPGQTVSVVFDAEGDYQITSTTTPHMHMTVNVSVSRGGGGGG
jgi:plastocyanin